MSIPKKNNIYNCFDDGKITKSRLYTVKVVEVIPFDEIDKKTLNIWRKAIKECDWLFNKETDFFIKTINGEDGDAVFVRTTDNGWFSLGDFMNSGRLDVDGILTDSLNLTEMTTESTNIQLPFQPPLLIADVSGSTSWDKWLLENETKLKELGYRKYVQNYKNEDFCYWKTFKNGEDKIYQIGVLFYDFRKYPYPSANRIVIMYECMIFCDDRIDMCVSKNIDLNEFELMSKTFYEAMSQYY